MPPAENRINATDPPEKDANAGPASSTGVEHKRLPLIDTLRGFAVAQMIVYHFIYDLNYFGWVKLAMNREQPWVSWRALIVTQFLLLVGLSLVLRHAFKPQWRDFWRRWAQVAGAAALVSAGSWLVFNQRFIWFGILHFVAVALILVRMALPWRNWLVLPAALALALGLLIREPFFDQAPWSLIGMTTLKPRTEDYVPLLPWLGVVLLGAVAGYRWQAAGFRLPGALASINASPPRLLTWLGGHALTVYLLHQPVLLGLLWLARQATRL
jgi:uncharacterized membrane protein